jgi:hypothetical protein
VTGVGQKDDPRLKPNNKQSNAHEPACNPAHFTLKIPHSMEHLTENETLILLPFAILAFVVLCLAVIAVIKFRRIDKDIVPTDDFPGRYKDSERPYYEYFN